MVYKGLIGKNNVHSFIKRFKFEWIVYVRFKAKICILFCLSFVQDI